MQRKSSTGKNSVAGAIVGSLCILVYFAALVIAAMQMYTSIEQRQNQAAREFYDIADIAASSGVLGFMNETFIETIDDKLAASSTLEAIIISGPNGEYAFERERGKSINWVNNTPRFKKRFDFLRQPLYQPLIIQGLRNVNIEARAGAIDYAKFTIILKQTLVVIVAALAVAFFGLMIENLIIKEKRQPFANFEPAAPQPLYNTAPQSAPGQNNAELRLKTGSPQREEAPRELYAPDSGVGWEDNTAGRLASELRRCAAAGQDIVFMAIAFRNKGQPGGFYRDFAGEAVRFFTQRDLIFEKGARGITVIIPGADLNTGFAKAAEFHSRISGKYPEVFTSKGDLCIGLSSRSGRLVETRRLMLETNEALTRAMSDPASHIIAFRVDPEKYRAYLNSKSTT